MIIISSVIPFLLFELEKASKIRFALNNACFQVWCASCWSLPDTSVGQVFPEGDHSVFWGSLVLKQESPIQAFKGVEVRFFYNAAPLSMRNSGLANFAAIFTAARQLEKMYLFECPFSISSPYTQDLLTAVHLDHCISLQIGPLASSPFFLPIKDIG